MPSPLATTKAGYSAEAVDNPGLTNRSTAIAALQKTSAHRFVLVTVRALYTNTLIHTEITYDVTLEEVLNRSGHTLARANAQSRRKTPRWQFLSSPLRTKASSRHDGLRPYRAEPV